MTVTDTVFLIGFILLIAGIALVDVPFALIIAGLLTMATGIAIANDTKVSKKKKK